MTALTFVTSAHASNDSSGTALAPTAFSLTGGNHIFVSVRFENTATTVSIGDTPGNTYTPLTQIAAGGNNNFVQIFYCLNATGNASNTVTATWSVAKSFRSIEILVFSGNLPTAGTQVSGTTTGATAVTSAAVTVAANSLLLAAECSFSADSGSETFTSSDGATWNDPIAGAYSLHHFAYAFPSAGTPTVTFTGNASSSKGIAVVPFAVPLNARTSDFFLLL